MSLDLSGRISAEAGALATRRARARTTAVARGPGRRRPLISFARRRSRRGALDAGAVGLGALVRLRQPGRMDADVAEHRTGAPGLGRRRVGRRRAAELVAAVQLLAHGA